MMCRHRQITHRVARVVSYVVNATKRCEGAASVRALLEYAIYNMQRCVDVAPLPSKRERQCQNLPPAPHFTVQVVHIVGAGKILKTIACAPKLNQR